MGALKGKNTLGTTTESYDRMAREYAVRNSCISRIQGQIDLFRKNLPRNGSVLDAGCGHGRDARYLYERGHEVVGIDLSLELLALARASAPSVEFVCADISTASLEADSFDGIWANAVLHHLDPESLSCAIHNFANWLRPRGVLFVSVRADSSTDWWDHSYEDCPRHYSAYSAEHLVSVLASEGFVVEHTLDSPHETKSEWLRILAFHHAD